MAMTYYNVMTYALYTMSSSLESINIARKLHTRNGRVCHVMLRVHSIIKSPSHPGLRCGIGSVHKLTMSMTWHCIIICNFLEQTIRALPTLTCIAITLSRRRLSVTVHVRNKISLELSTERYVQARRALELELSRAQLYCVSLVSLILDMHNIYMAF